MYKHLLIYIYIIYKMQISYNNFHNLYFLKNRFQKKNKMKNQELVIYNLT